MNHSNILNEEKVIEIILFLFAIDNKNKIDSDILLALLYLIDRESIKKNGYSKTGDNYLSSPNGPVPLELAYLIKYCSPFPEISPIWHGNIFSDKKNNTTEIFNFIQGGNLNQNDEMIIYNIWKKYGKLSKEKILEVMKSLPEWKNPQKNIKNNEITFEKIYRKTHHSINEDNIKKIIKEENEWRHDEIILGKIFKENLPKNEIKYFQNITEEQKFIAINNNFSCATSIKNISEETQEWMIKQEGIISVEYINNPSKKIQKFIIEKDIHNFTLLNNIDIEIQELIFNSLNIEEQLKIISTPVHFKKLEDFFKINEKKINHLKLCSDIGIFSDY